MQTPDTPATPQVTSPLPTHTTSGRDGGPATGTPHRTRLRTWVAAGTAVGIALALSACGGSDGPESVTPPPSATESGPSSAAAPGPQEGTDLELKRAESDGLSFDGYVYQGTGCPPDAGAVYPSAVTPGLTTSMRPGTGPKHGGQTWDASPRLFGAVPASPVEIQLSVTAPPAHSVTLKSLMFHVLSRQPQVKGVLLDIAGQCGAGGDYLYGVVDFDRPAPYWVPTGRMPKWYRQSPLVFPVVIAAGGSQSLLIDEQMEHCDCTWNAVLTWVDGASTRTWTIDEKGKPFQTTSVTGQTGILWSGAEPPAWRRLPYVKPE